MIKKPNQIKYSLEQQQTTTSTETKKKYTYNLFYRWFLTRILISKDFPWNARLWLPVLMCFVVAVGNNFRSETNFNVHANAWLKWRVLWMHLDGLAQAKQLRARTIQPKKSRHKKKSNKKRKIVCVVFISSLLRSFSFICCFVRMHREHFTPIFSPRRKFEIHCIFCAHSLFMISEWTFKKKRCDGKRWDNKWSTQQSGWLVGMHIMLTQKRSPRRKHKHNAHPEQKDRLPFQLTSAVDAVVISLPFHRFLFFVIFLLNCSRALCLEHIKPYIHCAYASILKFGFFFFIIRSF